MTTRVALWLSAAIIVAIFFTIVIYMYAERDKPIVFHITNCFASVDIDEDTASVETYRQPPPGGSRPPPLAASRESRRSPISHTAAPTASRLASRKLRKGRTADRRRGDASVSRGTPREPDPAFGVRRDPRTASPSAPVMTGALGAEPLGPPGARDSRSSEGSDSE
jgi:hypothetical protein